MRIRRIKEKYLEENQENQGKVSSRRIMRIKEKYLEGESREKI